MSEPTQNGEKEDDTGENRRGSMIIYRSLMEQFNKLPDADQAALWRAVTSFGLDGIVPPLTDIQSVIFGLIRPTLEKNRLQYAKGCKAKHKPNTSRTEAEPKPTRSKPEAYKDKDKDKDKDKITPPSDDGGEAFSLFWNSYPRKESKKDALRAFQKVKGPKHISSVLAALAHADFSPDPKFIPLPATWLNREVWKFDAPSSSPAATVSKKEGGAWHNTEPDGWQDWFRGEYEREPQPWAEVNEHLREAICREMRKRKGGAA